MWSRKELAGYGNGYVAERPTWIATISAGHARYTRLPGPRAHVHAEDKAPPLGRISMDLTPAPMTDLGHDPKSVELLGASVHDAGGGNDTIGYAKFSHVWCKRAG
jgi:alanine racemase